MDNKKYIKNGFYSLDKLTLEFMMRTDDAQLIMDRLEREPNAAHRTSNRMAVCFHNFYIDLPDKNSFYVGFEPNWIPNDKHAKTGRIEFNPSKVGHYKEFQEILKWIVVRSGTNVSPIRFDLAIDMSVGMEKCYLYKDKRTFKSYVNSAADRTESLGKHNSHGAVKLYNKALERGLKDLDLTRLELTIEYAQKGIQDVKSILPNIYVMDDYQLPVNLNGTDKVLLIAVMNEPNLLSELPHTKKKKIKAYLADMLLEHELNEEYYTSILHQIDRYVNYGLNKGPNVVPNIGPNAIPIIGPSVGQKASIVS